MVLMLIILLERRLRPPTLRTALRLIVDSSLSDLELPLLLAESDLGYWYGLF